MFVKLALDFDDVVSIDYPVEVAYTIVIPLYVYIYCVGYG